MTLGTEVYLSKKENFRREEAIVQNVKSKIEKKKNNKIDIQKFKWFDSASTSIIWCE